MTTQQLTQDELRQLYEAGASFVKWYPVGTPENISRRYYLDLRKGETIEAALVGYATQLLDEVYGDSDHGCILRHQDNTTSVTFREKETIRHPSLVDLIVDLARMKRDKVKVPESVTAKAEPIWIVGDKSKVVGREEFDQLRDVIEWLICDLHRNGNINIDAVPMLERLRKVVERG